MKRHGFTLIELAVVLAIVALAAGMAIPTMKRRYGRSDGGLSHGALLLRGHLRVARSLAIKNRAPAGVFYVLEDKTSRYFVAYQTDRRQAVKIPVYDEYGNIVDQEDRSVFLWDRPPGHYSNAKTLNARIDLQNVRWLTPGYSWERYYQVLVAMPSLQKMMDALPEAGLAGHIFKPDGTLDSYTPLKARIKITNDLASKTIEILGATGRVKILP